MSPALRLAGAGVSMAGRYLYNRYRNKSVAKYGAVTKRKRRVVRRTRGRRVRSRTVRYTKRRRVVKENMSTEASQIKLKGRARRTTAMQLARACMEEQWYRVQGLTAYDTSYGYYPLANRQETAGNQWVILPCHVWDLTSCPNSNGAGTLVGPAGIGLAWSNSTSAANAQYYTLNSQSPDATDLLGDSRWQYENISADAGAASDVMPHRKNYHHHTHIRMNLYGVRKRSTKFMVELMMVKQETADFLQASPTNIEKKRLYDYLTRPLVYSNLNMGDPQTSRDIRVLKRYEVIIGPTTLDDYGGETSATPHIKTVDWFIPHNRIRRFDWRKGDPQDHVQDAGWDQELAAGHDIRVDPKYRVYLVVRALCPERGTVDVTNNVPANPVSEPSYDIMIRNKFSNPV